jgi:hypothetical protein
VTFLKKYRRVEQWESIRQFKCAKRKKAQTHRLGLSFSEDNARIQKMIRIWLLPGKEGLLLLSLSEGETTFAHLIFIPVSVQ